MGWLCCVCANMSIFLTPCFHRWILQILYMRLASNVFGSTNFISSFVLRFSTPNWDEWMFNTKTKINVQCKLCGVSSFGTQWIPSRSVALTYSIIERELNRKYGICSEELSHVCFTLYLEVYIVKVFYIIILTLFSI